MIPFDDYKPTRQLLINMFTDNQIPMKKEKNMKYFIVVDMQNDFCTGSLANENAKKIIPNIKEKLTEYREKGYTIVYTKDTHEKNYLDTMEGKYLPVKHCINETNGWAIVDELKPCDNDIVLLKRHFGYVDWDKLIVPGDEVILSGTVTSICVLANAIAIKMIDEVNVSVIEDCCADITKENHLAAITVLKAQQVNIL